MKYAVSIFDSYVKGTSTQYCGRVVAIKLEPKMV